MKTAQQLQRIPREKVAFYFSPSTLFSAVFKRKRRVLAQRSPRLTIIFAIPLSSPLCPPPPLSSSLSPYPPIETAAS